MHIDFVLEFKSREFDGKYTFIVHSKIDKNQ